MKTTFYIQFRRTRGYLTATKMTQNPAKPPRGSGAVSVKFTVEVPSFVFDPLDLAAVVDVPAENTVAVIDVSTAQPPEPAVEPEG